MSADKQSQEPAARWGRVAEDGTVFVRTAEGERSVGQYPEGPAEDALKFFTDRYEGLELEVSLLVKRVSSGVLSPDEAAKAERASQALFGTNITELEETDTWRALKRRYCTSCINQFLEINQGCGLNRLIWQRVQGYL